MPGALTVWYNTKCPVCDGGIGWQQRRLVVAARSGLLQFRDINLEPDVLASRGIGIEAIRRRLHGVDGDDRLYVGADCAAEICLRTPGQAWLGHLLRWPGLRALARFSYDRFADVLYAWNRRKGHW